MSSCLLCELDMVESVITFPKTPIANELLSFDMKKSGITQSFYPLDLGICLNCGHIQLTFLLDPSLLFKNYPYLSNSNDQTASRFLSLANEFNRIANLDEAKFALEIGSNDGYLLAILKSNGWRVLGIDPSKKASAIATSKGVDNICEFYSSELSNRVLLKYGHPDLIIANNVLAHTNQMRDIFIGISKLMNFKTLFIMEFSYALDVYEKLLFDTIYHEHMSYHSIKPLTKFLSKFNLVIVDAIRFDAHGGSLRLYIKKNQSNILISNRVNEVLNLENKVDLSTKESWKKFELKINSLKADVNKTLNSILMDKKSIVGYGVPAKFTTLFYTLELNETCFQYIVDDNPLKHGRFAPGTNLEIFSVDKLLRDEIDYIFVFSWNYTDEIFQKIVKSRLCRL